MYVIPTCYKLRKKQILAKANHSDYQELFKVNASDFPLFAEVIIFLALNIVVSSH